MESQRSYCAPSAIQGVHASGSGPDFERKLHVAPVDRIELQISAKRSQSYCNLHNGRFGGWSGEGWSKTAKRTQSSRDLHTSMTASTDVGCSQWPKLRKRTQSSRDLHKQHAS